MINAKQIKLIWVLAKQIGFDEDQVHDIIFQFTARKSIKTLSDIEVSQIIDHFIRLGAQVKKRRKPFKELPLNVVELVRPKQVHLVNLLTIKLGWQDNPGRLEGFIKRIIKRDRIITKQDGMKVIEGLKSILNKKKDEALYPKTWKAV